MERLADHERTTSFGYWLRRRRKALDLTQAELARQTGCSLELIQKLEADARRPSRSLAARLADTLRLSMDERAVFIQAARSERSIDQLELPARPVEAQPLPSGTLTLLLAGIADGARLSAQFPGAMSSALVRHGTLLDTSVSIYGGVIVEHAGDRVLAAFTLAPAALAAALDAQRSLVAEPWRLPTPLRTRMALHTGSAAPHRGGCHEPALHRAEQLLAAGHGGQILVSLATAELVREQLPLAVALESLGVYQLGELSQPQQIFQAHAPGLPATFPPLNTPSVLRLP